MGIQDKRKVIRLSAMILMVSLIITTTITFFALNSIKDNTLTDTQDSLVSVLKATLEGIDLHIESEFDELKGIDSYL